MGVCKWRWPLNAWELWRHRWRTLKLASDVKWHWDISIRSQMILGHFHDVTLTKHTTLFSELSKSFQKMSRDTHQISQTTNSNFKLNVIFWWFNHVPRRLTLDSEPSWVVNFYRWSSGRLDSYGGGIQSLSHRFHRWQSNNIQDWEGCRKSWWRCSPLNHWAPIILLAMSGGWIRI
jgi:hypothetical protein